MNVRAFDELQTTTADDLATKSSVFRVALDALTDCVFLLDANCQTARALNTAAVDFAQSRKQDVALAVVAQLFPNLDTSLRSSAALTNRTVSGSYELYPVGIDGQPQFILVVRSAVEQNVADDLSRRDALDDAFHDPLTRLANRRLFDRRLQRAIDRAARSQYHFAVLFVDLDRFKQVNDRFGHLQGDRVLVAAAHRLVEAVRPQDMVARRDGDEFTILLDDLERPEDALQIAQRIVEHLQIPLGGADSQLAQVSIGASIGIAMANDARLSAEDLIARADSAMYQAKALGGNTYVNLDHAVPNPR